MVSSPALTGCRRDESSNTASGQFDPLHAGALTVGADFPAAGFWEGTDVDHLTGGFEYELADALADRFQLDLRVVDVAFDDLVEGVADDFDLALAQASITGDRSEILDFSEPYLTTPVGVVGRSHAELDVPDLATARTLTWGVAYDTTEVDVVEDQVRPSADAEVYATTAEMLDAAATGVVDVAALDYARALAEVQSDDRLVLVAQITAPQNYGAVLPKGSSNDEAVDSAIRALQSDGTLPKLVEQLHDRFGVDVNQVPTIRLPA